MNYNCTLINRVKSTECLHIASWVSRFSFLTLIFFLLNTSLSAQHREIKQKFEDGKYQEVINYYKAQQPDDAPLSYFIESYLRLGQYDEAIERARKHFILDEKDQEYIECYYKALIYGERYKDAFELVYREKDNILPKELADSLLNDAEKYMIWEYDKTDIFMRKLEKINTDNSEFCPVAYNDVLYYCTAGNAYSNEQERLGIQHIAMSEIDPESPSLSRNSKLNGFPNSAYKNITSFCIYGNEIYFTATRNSAGDNYNLKIVRGIISDDGKVLDEQELSFCSKDYSVAHPAISDDGTKLFFTSNMPGGYGLSDIYVSYRTPSGWGSPINLGQWVNTTGREGHSFYKDKTLYFSSDGLPGYGGRDIFKLEDDDYLETVFNLKAPINSPFDDFGIFFTQPNRGYFNSNRPGGAGNDDIYSFGLNTPKAITPIITGVMQQNGTPISNTLIHMIDLDDNIIEATTTDEYGAFSFNRQPNDGTYRIAIGKELNSKENVFMSLTDDAGNVTEKIEMNSKGIFVFEMLPLDSVEELSMFSIVDSKLYTIMIRGSVYNNIPGDLNKIFNIELQDKDYEPISYFKTINNGIFTANNIDFNHRFLFQIESGDKDLSMAVIDQDNQIIQELFSLGNNLFAYQHIGDPNDLISIINQSGEAELMVLNEVVKIPNVYYDFGSAALNKDSKESLQELIAMMKKNTNLKIELNSHTDNRGTTKANENLSNQRAELAKSYLVKSGVSAKRIIARGYGWTQQLIDCNTVDCDENDHAQNRRTEFKVVSK